jgi:hypothetical protein
MPVGAISEDNTAIRKAALRMFVIAGKAYIIQAKGCCVPSQEVQGKRI